MRTNMVIPLPGNKTLFNLQPPLSHAIGTNNALSVLPIIGLIIALYLVRAAASPLNR
jgi:hypothetical protein